MVQCVYTVYLSQTRDTAWDIRQQKHFGNTVTRQQYQREPREFIKRKNQRILFKKWSNNSNGYTKQKMFRRIAIIATNKQMGLNRKARTKNKDTK